jgi:hypothetical protein
MTACTDLKAAKANAIACLFQNVLNTIFTMNSAQAVGPWAELQFFRTLLLRNRFPIAKPMATAITMATVSNERVAMIITAVMLPGAFKQKRVRGHGIK